MKIQINSKIQILLGLIAGVTASFLQTPPDQFQSTFNSTFLAENGKLSRPIVIPNVTEFSKQSYAPKANLQKVKTKDNSILQIQQDKRDEKADLREEFKPSENRFSSRYSSEDEAYPESKNSEEAKEEKVTSITDIPLLLERGEPISSKISLPSPPKANSFSDRSDTVDDSEEEKVDGHHYPDSSEAREREESEITFTTNEPYSELRTSSSIRTSPDEHFENYETSSGVSDESDESEKEDGPEEKRSLDDYRNSRSKNHQSIQTPLSKIKYKSANEFRGDFDEEEKKEKTPNRLRLIKHNWPYTREQLTELGENDISDEEEETQNVESEEWGNREELKTPKKYTKEGLEQAVHKDESRYNRTRTHNHIDERKIRKQKAKILAEEEEKDQKSPFYKALKEYATEEEEPKYLPPAKSAKAPKKKHFEKTSAIPPTKKPKNIFFNYKPEVTIKPSNGSKELTLDFPVHKFLGPVVFDENHSKIHTTAKPKPTKTYNVPHRKYVKDLEQKEKLDQDRVTNQRFMSTMFTDKDVTYRSFNHLEESDEMYNAILSNIQSVFGQRTQPLKAGNEPEVSLESSALTWSVPLIKRHVKGHEGVLESATSGGVKSERAHAHKKSIFPIDIVQP